ncbi:MAG: PEPxxWA-CTERM sorting domain-containing protein [Pseudomonadota bacterium]
MNLIKTSLALLLAATGLSAQAAHFSLISGSVWGSSTTQISYLSTTEGIGGTLEDRSGSGTLLGIGSSASSTDNVSSAWTQSMLLDAASDSSNVVIQASRSVSLDAMQAMSVDFGNDTAYSKMLATLRIEGDGEADGSAVRVTFSGSADTILSSAVSAISTPTSLSMTVRGDGNSTIAEYAVATFSSDVFSFSFDTTIGTVLRLDIGFGTLSTLGSNMLGDVGPGNLFESSALVDGVLAVTPVPEPETYAMLLAGLGLIGAASRRRK